MKAWVPPRLLRRLGHVLWLPGAVALTAVLLPFYLVGALAALFTRRMRLLRVVSFAMAYIWTDVGMVLGCWLLWAAQPLPSRDETLWRERHAALLSRALALLSAASHSMLGYRVALDACPVPASDAPLLVLSRHAGPGDSFSMVQLLLATFRRRPKVVLKAALQWDPGIDLLLNRLDCYFLPSSSGAGEDKVEAVRDLALSLEPREALLIFPEGGNWTPKRHERAVRWLRRHGQAERAAEAEELEHVLPPRPGGVVATLSARPDLDVVVMAHTGLDLLVSPWDIWAALPIDHQPMTVHWWVTPAADVPRDPADILPWVDDVWADVDAWIEAESGGGPVAPSITLEPTPESVPGIPVAQVVVNPQDSES
ncbi:MAG: 1-acyl-sn-glycerol-3-phosphate acyltransferase [Lapillicoccus sp.]